MREIKFRAWDKVKKEMIYTDEYWIGKNGWDAVNRTKGVAFSITDSLNGLLMQYTGLKDKNGKEIYEGDVSKNYYKGEWVNLVVVWNPLGMWSVKWKDGYLNNYHIQNQNMEVIGNIYENPDLLKK